MSCIEATSAACTSCLHALQHATQPSRSKTTLKEMIHTSVRVFWESCWTTRIEQDSPHSHSSSMVGFKP